MLHDVVDDVLGRVIDAARLTHLRLLLDAHGLGRGPDGLALVAFVNRAEQLDADYVKALRVPERVEPFDDRHHDFGIDLDAFREMRLEDFAVEFFVGFVEERIQLPMLS